MMRSIWWWGWCVCLILWKTWEVECGSVFGRRFRITTFGESHGPALGVIVTGMPPRLPISTSVIQRDLDRRRPGQSHLTTPRREADKVHILSGVLQDHRHPPPTDSSTQKFGNTITEGWTTGAPIAMIIPNEDARSGDYRAFRDSYRPSHADATYDAKYGIRTIAGGGRSSARETAARVAAGALAKSVLSGYSNMTIVGFVRSVGDIVAPTHPSDVDVNIVESNLMRCPDLETANLMIKRVEETRRKGDSVGGVVEFVIRGVPPGLGNPVFDKLEACLAHACMSLPAAKGFEVGSGFEGTRLTGRQHNDVFYKDEETGHIRTSTNRSGGIQGGISNGEDIICRVAFKPTATIAAEQETVTRTLDTTTVRGTGRHDPCVLSRAVPLVEAMAALTLVDALMEHTAQCELFPRDAEFAGMDNMTEVSRLETSTEERVLHRALGMKFPSVADRMNQNPSVANDSI